jgi:hypothetical protein
MEIDKKYADEKILKKYKRKMIAKNLILSEMNANGAN